MDKILTRLDFINAMSLLGYEEHIFFLKDNDTEEKKSIFEWFDYCINTWIEVSRDLLDDSLKVADVIKSIDLNDAQRNLNMYIIPLLKLKRAMEV